MWFTVMGFYKPGIDTRPAVLQAALNEHIGQLNLQIRLAGPLRGPDGKTIGLMVITRADTLARADAYLHESPHYNAGLYERVVVADMPSKRGGSTEKVRAGRGNRRRFVLFQQRSVPI